MRATSAGHHSPGLCLESTHGGERGVDCRVAWKMGPSPPPSGHPAMPRAELCTIVTGDQ